MIWMLLLAFIINMFVAYFVIMVILVPRPINNKNRFYHALFMAVLMTIIDIVVLAMVSPQEVYQLDVILLLILMTLILFTTMVVIQQQQGIAAKDFLTGMIEHHQMAVVMAQELLKKQNVYQGVDQAQVQQLARNIIQEQNFEIELMRDLVDKGSSDKSVNIEENFGMSRIRLNSGN